MVYLLPKYYVCPKCKTEIIFGPHGPYTAFFHKDGVPFCPKCTILFLKQNIPLMEKKDESGN